MSSSFSETERDALESRKADLVAEFEALSEQLGYEVVEADRLRLTRRLERTKREIETVEEQIRQLDSGPTPGEESPAAPSPSASSEGRRGGCRMGFGSWGVRFKAWFDEQEPVVKAAVIAGIFALLAPICGGLLRYGEPVAAEVVRILFSTATPTSTITLTPTDTPVLASTHMPTATSTPVLTSTPSPTSTATSTPSPTPTPITCGTPHPRIISSIHIPGTVTITDPESNDPDCVPVGERQAITVSWDSVPAEVSLWMLVYSPIAIRYYPHLCATRLQPTGGQNCGVILGKLEPYEVVAVLANQSAHEFLQASAVVGGGITPEELPDGIAEKDSLRVVRTE